jgi:hypothetical protein
LAVGQRAIEASTAQLEELLARRFRRSRKPAGFLPAESAGSLDENSDVRSLVLGRKCGLG